MRFYPGPIWIALFMLLSLVPTLTCATTIQAGPWLQAMTETSIVVMWETDTFTDGTVLFGETTAYGLTRMSSAKRIAATSVSGDTDAVLHEVKLTGLRPGTRYHYQVQTGNAQSRDHTWTTHTKQDVWRFTHTVSPNALVPTKANRTWASMWAARPDFIVISGDISNKATNSDFHKFFTRAYPLAADTPVYTVQGNHDDRDWSVYDAWVHNDTSDHASEGFYAFDIGPGHFVGVNDNTPRADAFPVSWFERTLAQSRARWNIVFMNGNYRKYKFVQELLEDNKANIDVILTSGGGNQYLDQDGILHVESGGADQVYHVIEMTDTSFRATLYQSDGSKKGSEAIGSPKAEPNTPPVARLRVTPLVGAAPLEVTFDGTASTDREGQIVAYDWELGDGVVSSGEVVRHLYEAPGDYTVQLTVTDVEGTRDTTTTRVTVDAAADKDETEVFETQPVADSYVYELQANTAFGARPIVQIRGASKDRIAYLQFDLRQAPAYRAVRAALKVYASYVSSGATVPVTVVGVNDDRWTEAGLTWNRAPVLGEVLARLDVRQIGEYVFDVTSFVNDQLGGDQIVTLALLDAQERDKLVNLWSREAIRNQPELIITYDVGAPVANEPPVVEMSTSPDVGEAPLTVTFDGSASTDAERQGLEYDWNFGDGITASGAVVQHTYIAAGTYTAQLTVTDAAGASALADTLIAVRAAADRNDEFVANGGFENLDEGDKPYDWYLGATGAWQVVDTEVSTGIYSLQLQEADQASRTPIASAMTVWLEPGVYALCADLATDRLGTQDGKRRGVRVSLKDESIQQGSGNIASTSMLRGTHNWHQICQGVEIQQEGDYTVRIEAVNQPNGRAWIDGVSLIKKGTM